MGAGPVEIGRFTFTAAEIVRFARAFDPQPFHVDPEAARHAPDGGLIASGWHVAAVWMGLFVRAHPAAQPLSAPDGAEPDGPAAAAARIAPVGVGFGLADLRWLAPVRAGDAVVFDTEVIAARESASRPGWAVFHRRNAARRDDGTKVLCFEIRHLAPMAGAVGLPAGTAGQVP